MMFELKPMCPETYRQQTRRSTLYIALTFIVLALLVSGLAVMVIALLTSIFDARLDARTAALADSLTLYIRSIDLGQREPGGSIGICSNAHVPMSVAAQGCVEVLRELGQAYGEGIYP